MAYSTFPLFQSHLDLSHSYWERLILKGDIVIDATCGNGHDTLKLASLALMETNGQIWGFDIQQQALDNTRKLLEEELPPSYLKHIFLRNESHRTFPPEITEESVRLIVYNLGYLPGGNKSNTTKVESTLESLSNAKKLISSGGAISITCYPGHEEGAREQEAIVDAIAKWPPRAWNCTTHQWPNRRQAPTLLLIQRQKT